MKHLVISLMVLAACGGGQPAPRSEPPAKSTEPVEADDDYGVEGGVEGGEVGGVMGGEPPPPPPPPPPPTEPQIIAPEALAANQLYGDDPEPSDAVLDALAASGRSKVATVFKLCIDVNGAISSLTVMKASGIEGWDELCEATLSEWAHKPFIVNGQAEPVCTVLTIALKS